MSLPILPSLAGWPSLLLERAAAVDPEAGMEAAEEAAAWVAFRDAVSDRSAESIIALVSEAGLRGRGGAGFPTGRKWRDCAAQPVPQRYVVANGFEADPGVQVDRTLMELDPHAVVEGAALAAFAVRAEEAVIVVRDTALAAAARLRRAIAEAERRGYLGESVLGTGRALRVEVRELPGSFVVGEETVLLRALENRRAQPDQRPPYPTVHGLWGKPTVVDNVKTLALVPWIVRHGARAFTALGISEAPGTTLLQLGGALGRPGIAEVPLGASLRDVLEGPGGCDLGAVKAVLVGGPTGGFLPPASLDTRFSYEDLAEAGCLAGSGSMLTLDDSTCLVDLAALMTRFLADEACGKTIPCRIGTRRLSELGGGFCSGFARPTDAALLNDLARDMRDGALCALEGGASNPLLSGMRYFGAEFDEHILRGRCPAGICQPASLAGAAR